jgi:RNA polymerase-binding transcription factor DksA
MPTNPYKPLPFGLHLENDPLGHLVSTLEQVQDALHRIENGTYGTCIVCGRSIEPARLEALPWAAKCLLEDQENQDARRPINEG